MQNIKLTLQYDGTRYLGWKRPEKDHNDRTVSYKIENVLERGCEITVSTEKEDLSFKMNERSSFMLKLTCDENFNYKL